MTGKPVIARQARSVTRVFGTAGFAAVLLLAAIGVPALASSGINEICKHPAQPLPAAKAVQPAPKLTANTETSLDEVLADDASDAGNTPAKASDKADSESGSAVEAASMRNIEFPHVATSLPGTSDSTLPSFRRQMFRTDI
jgi:hypothetical protein